MIHRKLEPLAEAIRGAQTVALISHINPDGDTVGSTLALRLALMKLGKTVSVFDRDKIPDNLRMLDGYSAYRTPDTLGAEERFDLVMSVDVSDAGRMGSCDVLMSRAAATAQIDHHATNPGFMQVNVVDGGASATGCMIDELLGLLGIEPDREIAKCLYTAISTDTGNFAFDNTTPEALEVTAKLIECGLPIAEMNRALFRSRDPAQVRLIGRAIASMTARMDGKLNVMTLSRCDFEECGALEEHADTVVNYAMDVNGACMALLARETPNGNVKFSLRSVAPYHVETVARLFSGGGHGQAAGASMTDGTPLREAAAKVADAMEAALREQEKEFA